MTSAPTPDPAPGPKPAHSPATSIRVEAVYQDGVIKPLTPLNLPDNLPVTLHIALAATVMVEEGVEEVAGAAPARPSAAGVIARLGRPLAEHGLLARLTWLELALATSVLLVYLLTRFTGLAQFPIYFFCDEAIHTNLAEQLVLHGLRDEQGVLLPPYFRNDDKWNLSLSVYIHMIGQLLLGKSVVATRATSAGVSVLALLAVMLTLKLIFDSRLWWLGGLALTAVPTWFLHSRTAFETVMATSFYACFLCSYLLYRYRSPRYAPLAALFAAAMFYSYANGQGLMVASIGLLLLSDLRYHLRHWRALLAGALLLALLGLPYLRFRMLYPAALQEHLGVLDSYWLRPIPLREKLTAFAGLYLQALNPAYWFLPNQIDLDRHQMKGMGHVPLLFLPAVLLGVGVCLAKWRSAAHRTVLIALLAVPFSPALVGILVTRVLALVIPITLLFVIGLDQLFSRLARRVAYKALAAGAGLVVLATSLLTLRTALVDGPTWYTNYGLYGMQYGASQVFGAVKERLEQDPSTQVLMSPNWANNPYSFVRFFLPPAQQERVRLTGIDTYLSYKTEIPADQLFVLPGDEFERARDSGKLLIETPERVLNYPDGRPGFYFVHMRYVDQVDAIFAAERERRRRLQAKTISLDGQQVQARYSLLDIGALEQLFDADPSSLIRGFEANPLVLEFTFAEPRAISSLGLDVATMNFSVTVELAQADGTQTRVTNDYRDLPKEPHVDITVPNGPIATHRLRLEISNLDVGEPAHIHVRELAIR